MDNKSTSVRIPKEQYAALREIAKRRGMLLSALLGRVLDRYIAEANGGQKP